MSATETPARRSRTTGRPPGRPTKLTPTLVEAICAKIRDGVPPVPAAVSLGVAESTFKTWLRDGQAENAPARLREFVLEFKQANAEYHAIMAKRASEDPRHTVAVLERRFKEDWARQDNHRIDVQVSQRPLIDPSKGPIERLVLLRELLAEFSPDAVDLPKDGVPAHELLAASIEGVVLREEDA